MPLVDVQGLVARFRAAIADALLADWERLAAHLEHRLAKGVEDDVDAALDDYDWTDLAEDLQDDAVLVPLAMAFSMGSVESQLQLGVHWGGVHDAALAYARERAAEMVGMRRLPNGRLVPHPAARWRIDETTRERLRDLVLQALEEGGSYRDLKARIEAMPQFSGLFGEARAEAIARTELALAANHGHFATFEAGGYTHVRVLDGPECGWTRHDDPDLAHGSIRTLEEARQHPLSHPNCRRAFQALTAEEAEAALRGAATKAEGAGITVDLGLVGYHLEGQRPRRRNPRCLACRGIPGAPCVCEEEEP